MKIKFFPALAGWALGLLLLATGLHAQVPRDNPYRTFYGNDSLAHWTDGLAWQRVFNVKDFAGASIDEQCAAAQQAAVDAGGGVVFFPAGTYEFSEDLVIRDGVILRGATPPVLSAKDSAFAPPTRFEFPEYKPQFSGQGTPDSTAFKNIIAETQGSNLGIVYVDINKAGVVLTPSRRGTVQTPEGPKEWLLDSTVNLICFGVRSNNVATPAPGLPTEEMHPWQRFSYRFGRNIYVFTKENAVVCNNRVNDFENNTTRPVENLSFAQPGFVAKLPDGTWGPVEDYIDNNFPDSLNNPKVDSIGTIFSYTDHYGIYVNRKGAKPHATPEVQPDLFNKGVEVNDNWVYHTMRVGIYAAGLGLEVKRNVVRDLEGKRVILHPTGKKVNTNNAATYENRAIDISGWNVEVTHNDYQVERGIIRDGPYKTVDGEGILAQECCGGTSVIGYNISHNIGNSFIGLWKMRDMYDLRIADNTFRECNDIILTAHTNGNTDSYTLQNVVVEGNKGVGRISMTGPEGGKNVVVRNNEGCQGATLQRPCYARLENNSNFTGTADCNSTPALQEALFQFNLSPDDSLIVASSFPVSLDVDLQELSGNFDQLVLYESGLPSDTAATQISKTVQIREPGTYFFRGRAVDSDDPDQWSATKKVQVKVVTGLAQQHAPALGKLSLFPNPTEDRLFLRGEGLNSPLRSYRILSMSGRVVRSSTPLHLQPGQEGRISVADLPKGTYLLQLQGAAGRQVLRFAK